MKIGDRATVTRTYGAGDLSDYRSLAGASAEPRDRVPEPLIGGLFSYLLGVELPGRGTNYLKQEMRFLDAATVDEPLTAAVEVTRLRPEKALVDLATTCRDSRGRTICEGRALVLFTDTGPDNGPDRRDEP